MAKPSFSTIAGTAAAWGDLAETTERQLKNLFAVSIRLPTALKTLFPAAGPTISMLASAATLPEEVVTLAQVETKLSNYDIVVGKARGELGFTFMEQVGAPVTRLFDAWHNLIVSPRDKGIAFPAAYRTEVWAMPLTGDGAPYYFFGFRGAFPTGRGKADFANTEKTAQDIVIPWSYIERIDEAEALAGEGANFASRLSAGGSAIGI